MLDNFLDEQKIPYKIIKNAGKKQHFSHAYLIETNNYDKKEQFVLAFAKYLLCPNFYSNFNNCVNCTQCHNIDINNFSEIKIIRPDGMWIKKEQLDNLQQEFMKTSVQTDKRVYIIFNAEKMNVSASNSILKFLEEPEANIVAILVTDNMHQLLSTIISRCQIISLIKNKTLGVEEKIFYSISSGEDINPLDIKKYVQAIIHFVVEFDKKGIDLLLETQKLWHQIFSDREKILLGLNIMILYYRDLLNYKLELPLEYFDEDSILLLNIEKNTIKSISNKIKIINEYKENIKINMNNSLLIDKMIIQMEEGEEYE